jgi:hypothetical protein
MHIVRCPACGHGFDLFSARWCGHRRRSKICPTCGECACAVPGYGDERLWTEAPRALRRLGFERLFVHYL